MAVLPSTSNIAPRQYQQPQRAVVGGPAMSFGQSQIEAQGTAAVANEASNVSQRMFTLQDAVHRTKARTAFSEFLQETTNRYETEHDLTDNDTLKEYGKVISQRQMELLASHKGSPESRADLAMRLEEARSNAAGNMAGRSLQLQKQLVEEGLSSAMSAISSSVYDTPGSFDEQRELWRSEVRENSGAMNAVEQRVHEIGGAVAMADSAVTGYLDRGQYDEAIEFLNRPDIAELMPPEKQRNYRSRVTVQRIAQDREDRALQIKQRQMEAFLGRPLTQGEKLRSLGLEPTPGPRTLAMEIAEIEALGVTVTNDMIAKKAGMYIPPSGAGTGDMFGTGVTGRALEIMTEIAPAYEAGLLDPQTERMFMAAVTEYTQPRQFMNPDTGLMETRAPELPPFVRDAMSTRPFSSGQHAPSTGPSMEQELESESPLNVGSGRTVWEMTGQMSGPVAAGARGISSMPGIGGLLPESVHEYGRVAAEVPIVLREAVTALRSNPRFAEGERQDIQRDLQIDPALWDNPVALKHRITGMDDALAIREQNARRTANSTNVSGEERRKAMDILNLIVPIRQKIGVPMLVQSPEQARQFMEQGLLQPGQTFRTPDGTELIAPSTLPEEPPSE